MGKVLRYGILAILLVIIFIAMVPWLFKGQIFELIKKEANNSLKGELEIADMSLSLFRDFPNLTLTLEDLSYTCDAEFDSIKLFEIEKVRAELDVMTVFRGQQIKVNEIVVTNPDVHLIILPNGAANYLIFKEDTLATEATQDTAITAFNVKLSAFSISGIRLIYDDFESDMNLQLRHGDFHLHGDLSEAETDLDIRTRIDSLTYIYSGLAYLSDASLVGEMRANYNQKTGRLTMADNDFWLNKLNLLFEGWVESYDEKLSLNLTASAPHANLKEFLSLIPAVYTKDFEDLKATGKFALSAYVKGDYFYEGEDMPAFGLKANLQNGTVKYPSLPASLSAIEIDASISHPGGDLDKTVVNISKAKMRMASSPFAMRLVMKTPISDPFIDFSLQTKLDLGKLRDIFVLEGTELSGLLAADATIKGNLSQFEAGAFDKVEAHGYINSRQMGIKTTALTQPIFIDTLYTAISPQVFSLNPMSLKIGKSDFTGKGQFSNMLSYVLTDDTLNGDFSFSSQNINVTELMNALASEEEAPVSATKTEARLEVVTIPANLNLSIAATATNVVYDNLNLQNATAVLLVHNQKVELKNVLFDVFGGKIGMDGSYSTPNNRPKVDMNLRLQKLDAKSSFAGFSTIKAFAPIVENALGTFGGTLNFSSTLGSDFLPDLTTLSSTGSLVTTALAVQPQIMKQISGILKNEAYSAVALQDANLSYSIANGRVTVNPFKVKIGDATAEFSGSQGLDQTLDYRLKSNISIDKIKLPEEVKALNVNKGTIPVEFKITGTVTKPIVKPFFGTAEGFKELVTQVVDKAVEQAKDSAINTVNREAERIMDEAQKQADAVIATAEAQVATLKAETRKQADQLKTEAKKQADKLVAEAKGNALQEIAAQKAADAVIRDANKKIEGLNNEAAKKSEKIMTDARAKSDKILSDAREKAKIAK